MSFVQRIEACNNADLSRFLPLIVDDQRVGWLRPAFIQHLLEWPGLFRVEASEVRFSPKPNGFEERTQAVGEVIAHLVRQGVIHRVHGELYPVTPSTREQGLFLLDRAAAPYFGIRAFGQHINGYVHRGGDLCLWVGRRSRNKANFPSRLDNLVAGGLPHGIGLEENLSKECWEEAGIPPGLAIKAVPVGAISYCAETPRGLKPDLMYCYDLELPEDFVPRCNDGEVEEFYLWPQEQVAEVVSESDEFKPNCDLVIIDFLIRHGYIAPHHPDYLELVTGLHARKGHPWAVGG